VKERGLIFTGESIPGLLSGAKTQTRRVISAQPVLVEGRTWEWPFITEKLPDGSWRRLKASWADGIRDVTVPMAQFCPYQPGDRIWVRETWYSDWDKKNPFRWAHYKADLMCRHEHNGQPINEPWFKSGHRGPWKSPRFMPRWASRMTLELTGIRVERLQAISEADAIAEGVADKAVEGDVVGAYAMTWDLLNERRGFPWESNLWVWVLEFRLIDKLS